jgi:hypothetical protein
MAAKASVVRRLELALDVLSRLTARLESGDLARELERALSVFANPATASRLHALWGPLSTLLERTLLAMPSTVIGARLPELFAIPIAGSAGVPVSGESHWPEPAAMLPMIPCNARAEDDPRWPKLVSVLLDSASALGTRPGAILRLASLAEGGNLKPDELTRFAEMLWRDREPETGLPVSHGLTVPTLLRLPTPPDVDAAGLVKRSLLRATPARLGSTAGTSWSISFGGRPEHYFEDLVAATRPAPHLNSERPVTSVTWSATEIKEIWGKVSGWWVHDGLIHASRVAQSGLGAMVSIDSMVDAALDVVRVVILPVCGAELAQEIGVVLDKMVECGFGVGSCEFALSPYDGQRGEVAKRRIIEDLGSQRRQVTRAAAFGVFYWAVESEGGTVPSPPQEIVHALGDVISSRLEPALGPAMQAAKGLISSHPELVDNELMQRLRVGLRALAGILYGEVSSVDERGAYVPRYRTEAAALAAAINHMNPEDQVARDWVTRARSDPLPEVRRAAGAL